MRPDLEAARKSGAEAGNALFQTRWQLALQLLYSPNLGPGGLDLLLDYRREMKYNQYHQQRGCQVSTDNIFMGRWIVLLSGFCEEGGLQEHVHRSSESIIYSLLVGTGEGGSGVL